MFETDQDVNESLLFQLPFTPITDLGVVLGGRSTSGTLARAAARAYKRGQFERLVVAGGARVFQPGVYAALRFSQFHETMPDASEFFSLKTEADFIHHALLKNGVPQHAIVRVSPKGKNTGADLFHIKDVFKDCTSVTLIDLAPGQRRTIGTAIKVIGDRITYVPLPVYPFGITRENWTRSKLARKFVLNEARKIDPTKPNNYIDKGFCVITTPSKIQERAASLPRILTPEL